MKILIVDDNKDIAEFVKVALIAKGYDVKHCDNGKDGLREIQTKNYNLILLDIAMPDFSGIDLLDKLEKEDKIENYNIVLFTASSIRDGEVSEQIERGVKDCLRKPVELSKIYGVIEKLNPGK